MKRESYLRDISEIKNILEKSSKFKSLSGLSSLYTGIYYLIGGMYYFINEIETKNYSPLIALLLFIIISVLSFFTTIFLTKKRALKTNEKAWSISTKQLAKTFSTTFIIGTSYILILFFQEKFFELIPLVPFVYGLSLIHASKHTKNILRPLGVIHVIAAFLCVLFIEKSFWFYILSFGVSHLINGFIIYYTYDKNQ